MHSDKPKLSIHDIIKGKTVVTIGGEKEIKFAWWNTLHSKLGLRLHFLGRREVAQSSYGVFNRVAIPLFLLWTHRSVCNER